MPYKLLALDIDGTIVKEHTNQPTEPVIQAIKAAKNIGVHISLISARAWKEQKLIVDLLGLSDCYHALENGSKVISPGGKIEYDYSLPSNMAAKIVQSAGSEYESLGYCVDGVWRQEITKGDRVSTLSFICSSKAVGQSIRGNLLIDSKDLVITVGAHWENPDWSVVLISDSRASKGSGLKYVQGRLGITPEETIAVGDGASDVSSMQYAGLKVAMGNAEPELLEVANYKAPPVSQDGLSQVIERFILN